MANSTAKQRPTKPYPGFPLTAHPSGRYCKKIKGKVYYFGSWADGWEAAEARYKAQRADLEAGKETALGSRHKPGEVTLHQLFNAFLASKEKWLEAGKLAHSTFNNYRDCCKVMLDHWGKSQLVCELQPSDFETLRLKLSTKKVYQKVWGPVTLNNFIVRARAAFKWGYKNRLLKDEVCYGDGFSRPTAREMRADKQKRGSKMFEAREIRRLIKNANPGLRAMILLAINLGYGNSDCGQLTFANVNLEAGTINFPRPKTCIGRRGHLWPETILALREWLQVRPQPASENLSQLVFLTAQGNTWMKSTNDNPVSKEINKLLKRVKLEQTGRGFYGLRHSHRTISDEVRDPVACDVVMGHLTAGIASTYRDRVSDKRVKAVTDCVRKWLFRRESPDVWRWLAKRQ